MRLSIPMTRSVRAFVVCDDDRPHRALGQKIDLLSGESLGDYRRQLELRDLSMKPPGEKFFSRPVEKPTVANYHSGLGRIVRDKNLCIRDSVAYDSRYPDDSELLIPESLGLRHAREYISVSSFGRKKMIQSLISVLAALSDGAPSMMEV